MPARRRQLIAALLLLAASVALPFTFHYEPTYDFPNTGDETMSLTQAMNAARTRVPSYGQLADGRPWTLGPVTLPVYFFIYGPVAAWSAPMMRLPAARITSRALMGAALFVWLLALARAWLRRARRGVGDGIVLGLAVAAVLWLFLFVEPFNYIASSARVDAIGLLTESIFLWLAIELAEQPSEKRLFAAGAAAIAAVFSSFLAGALCGAASVALFLGYVSAAPRSQRKLGRGLLVGGAVAALGALLFVIFNFVILRVPLHGHENDAFTSEIAGIGERARHLIPRPWEVRDELGRYSSGALYLGAALASLALLAWRRFRRAGDGARFGTVAALALSSTLAVHYVFISPRHVYTALVFAAVALPLTVTLVRAEGQLAPRLALVALLAGLSFGWMNLRVIGARPIDFFRGHNTLAWQHRRAHNVELNHITANKRRDTQLRLLFAFLGQHNIGRVMVTDPMFALLDSDRRRFDFIYDTGLDAARELELIKRYSDDKGVAWLVSTPFGDSGWLHPLGLPRLKAALVAARPTIEPDSIEYPGARIRFTRVFESSLITDRDVYTYGDAPSTPIFVYRLDLVPAPAN